MVKLLPVIAAALCAVDAAIAAPTWGWPSWNWWNRKGLGNAARARGKYFGTATDNIYLPDKAYLRKLLDINEFGQITPSNTLKWETTEPEQGRFNFTPGDELVNLALRNGKFVRCHTLVWHSQLAPWVEAQEWTNETLIEAMTNHVTTVAKHFKGRCYAWDVVNEALNEDGTFRESIFLKVIGPEYIPIAFAAAAAADPHAKLYYNDYNLEWRSEKSEGARRIVKMIQDYGARIDGVGMQAHLILGETPSTEEQMAVIRSYTELGVEVAYTELDIRMELPPTKEKLRQQKEEYYNTIRACVKSWKCVGVTIWDWTDKYSWIPEVFEGEGAALPWDRELKKKPAYYGIEKAFKKWF
ncbi:hypothetical protein VTO42DRAFT_278 [Malbranchea cinnamomea]